MLAATQELFAKPQQGVLINGKAKQCDGNPITCPNGHQTCKEINAPIAVGNDSYQNPETFQLKDFTVLWCEQCGVLFARKNG